MPLNTAGLTSDLESLFSDPPGERVACAKAWADVMAAYFSGVTPPSTAVAAASQTLQGALLSAFQSTGGAAALMETAFLAFAGTVGAGMVPFIAVPPPKPVGFAAQLAINQSTHAEAANAWATLIDTWARTGSATPPPPATAPVLWS